MLIVTQVYVTTIRVHLLNVCQVIVMAFPLLVYLAGVCECPHICQVSACQVQTSRVSTPAVVDLIIKTLLISLTAVTFTDSRWETGE
jgi:hypothetical protein